jgi:hypothetical protein
VFIELERVTHAAVLIECDLAKERAARAGLVTRGAVERLPIHERDVVCLHEMPAMIELQRVAVAQPIGQQTKLRMVFLEARDHRRKTFGRAGCLENLRAERWMHIERTSRQFAAFLRGFSHLLRVPVTVQAL